MKHSLFSFLILFCSINAFAVELIESLTLKCDTTKSRENRSGIGYNPINKLYYSVTTGHRNFPIETFSSTGDSLNFTTQGFDYRGAWWNPNTNTFEGTGYSDRGISVQTLVNDSLPEAPGTSTVTSLTDNKPDIQSCGDYDPDADEIVYYYNSRVYRYERSDHSLIGSDSITDLPVDISNLNSSSIVVTGKDTVGVYDYVNKALYLLDKNTAAYLTTVQLEASAPAADQFKVSFANGYLFLFDKTSYEWKGYLLEIEDVPTALSDFSSSTSSLYPNPFNNSFVLSLNNNETAEYKIMSTSGTIIETGTANTGEILGQNLRAGIYKILVSTNNKTFTETIIKQ